MDSDIFFKVPSCSLGSEFGSLLPECVSSGAPLYHSVMGRCVLGALDRPAVRLMKLLELASGQYCHKLAQGHLMVLLNFCLEWHSPGTYSIVINVCVHLSRLLSMCVALLLCCSSGTFHRIFCSGFPKSQLMSIDTQVIGQANFLRTLSKRLTRCFLRLVLCVLYPNPAAHFMHRALLLGKHAWKPLYMVFYFQLPTWRCLLLHAPPVF